MFDILRKMLKRPGKTSTCPPYTACSPIRAISMCVICTKSPVLKQVLFGGKLRAIKITVYSVMLQLVCPYCYQIFRIKQAYVYHLSGVHNIGEKMRCEHCGRDDFKAYATFTKHKRKCKTSKEGTK